MKNKILLLMKMIFNADRRKSLDCQYNLCPGQANADLRGYLRELVLHSREFALNISIVYYTVYLNSKLKFCY